MHDPRKRRALADMVKEFAVNLCCIQETKLADPDRRILEELGAGRLDQMIWKNAIGTSGGIIIAWNSAVWEKMDWLEGGWSLSILLRNKLSNGCCAFSGVYGPHEAVNMRSLWMELSAVRAAWGVPGCIAGDFNITRYCGERNRDDQESRTMQIFSEWINEEALLDLPIPNHAFTWSNMRDDPALARLDRVLIDMDWDDIFPGCEVRGLTRILSDHTPLFFSSQTSQRKPRKFHFESWWARVEGFDEVVRESWDADAGGRQGARRLAFKLRRLKHKLKVWGKQAKRQQTQKKNDLAVTIDEVDVAEDAGGLTEEERRRRLQSRMDYAEVLKQEEIEWRQRSKALWLKAGDNNTRYFHKMASIRKRSNRISQLLVDDVLIENENDIGIALADHFQKAFKKDRGWRPRWFDEDLLRLPTSCLEELEAVFSEEEVKAAVFGADGDKATGPDGFGLHFFQNHWNVVRGDVMDVFTELQRGAAGLGCLNA
ncbi:hypothetical protein QJS10_CPA08g00605 [Acorus calamus]|uniref:Endonuclease/exonuclease/phosphatase domain-containing protein n=1 Tax=Acorus calamus TaxID=4465 RepID=A0AAV9EF34_ACOCL|nr:hypothetical protein QJS10_CPA08g00605 [Acorus calamus]